MQSSKAKNYICKSTEQTHAEIKLKRDVLRLSKINIFKTTITYSLKIKTSTRRQEEELVEIFSLKT